MDADCSFANNAPATNKSSLLHDSCSMQTIELTSEFRQKIDEYDADKITYVTPKYADFVEKKRLFATGVFGKFLRVGLCWLKEIFWAAHLQLVQF